MKTSKHIFIVLAVLAIVTLACGSSNDVVVNTPGGETSNQEQQQASPTSTTQVGTVRSNPAPAGSEVVVDDMAFVVLNKIRPANDIVKTGNEFNTDPETGKEYMFVELKVTCRKTVDEKCSFDSYFSTKIIGSKGIEYDPDSFVAGVENLLSSTEFYGDAVITGYIPFIVDQDDTNLLLVYEPFLGDAFYLAIP